jgi:hypothetical protein
VLAENLETALTEVLFSSRLIQPQINVENRDYHQLSQSEIAGAKRISRHLSA